MNASAFCHTVMFEPCIEYVCIYQDALSVVCA